MSASEIEDLKKADLVGRYAMPIALFLVAGGVLLTQPTGKIKAWSLSLLALGMAINFGVTFWMRSVGRADRAVLKMRLVANIVINAAIVYVLGAHWQPIWLLLALTPIATAVYASRASTLFSAGLVSGILVAIRLTREHNSPIEWGQEMAHVLFLVLISLMVNELVKAKEKK